MEEGERDWQREPAWAGAAWVQVKNTAANLALRLVRVTIDNDPNACGFGHNVQVFDGMHHVDERAGEFYRFGRRQQGTGAGTVDVAADGSDGRELQKFRENRRVADVTSVEDVLHATQGFNGLGPKQTVGV